MLEKVMKMNSDKSFVFVGPIEAENISKKNQKHLIFYLIEKCLCQINASCFKKKHLILPLFI
jgi:hypothetical protein